MAGLDGLLELLLEQFRRQVAGAVARRVEVGDVAGQYAMACFRKVDDLLQERNRRGTENVTRAWLRPAIVLATPGLSKLPIRGETRPMQLPCRGGA